MNTQIQMYLYYINTTLALICLIANVFSYCDLVRVTYKHVKLITKTFNSEEIVTVEKQQTK